MSLRLCNKCCGVTVATKLSPALCTNCAASLVVMCSNTIFKLGTLAIIGNNTSSINTASRSKISMCEWVTSPCTNNNTPCSAMASSTGNSLNKSVTPESELVVAPAGYNLNATMPAAFAAATVATSVLSVKYKLIKGVNATPAGTAAKISSR